MHFLKKMEIVDKLDSLDKLVLHLIILQFIFIYFINNAPPFVLMSNINSIIVGAFFLLNNVTHFYSRRAAIYSIPFVVLVSFLSTDGFLKYFGAIFCFTSMLINWTFFDYFLSERKNINKSLPFYKSSCFWTAAVGSNFMCAAIDSIQFSIGVESIPPQFNQMGAIVALCFLFSFFAITLRNDEKLLRLFAFIFSMSLFIYIWRTMNNIWVDPFAYELASFLCSCKPDENLAWIVDIASTSLFKVMIPTFAWWILHLYNKKTGVLQRG